MLQFAEDTTGGCLGLIFRAMYWAAFIFLLVISGGLLVQFLGPILGGLLFLMFIRYLRR